MKSLSNIFTKLKEKLRLMIIKTSKRILESQLKYFYNEIYFYQDDPLLHFKFTFISHLINKNEADKLRSAILKSILNEGLIFEKGKIEEFKTSELENVKNRIKTNQEINGVVNMRIIFQRAFYENSISSQSFELNILKKTDTPFKDIGDLFVFKIDKSILEDEK
ncbi:hypothetical protein [Flavobacterium sp. UBA4197]|uniref:hypothetical protein n=1 Tax=Flavobacterium sp. UBA4197 TaxID=1946546 RepID=UPI00257BEBA2|nr:hypothetical protein [Flavobacterium sp. UBA4197]